MKNLSKKEQKKLKELDSLISSLINEKFEIIKEIWEKWIN